MARHVVHIERVPGKPEVKIWLDGVPVRGLRAWSLTEGVGDPSDLALAILPASIVWGAPASIPAPARPHHPC